MTCATVPSQCFHSGCGERPFSSFSSPTMSDPILGFKFGLYTDRGRKTCAGREGSEGEAPYAEQMIETFETKTF